MFSPAVVRTVRPSLSYLEKRELEQLEIDIERLEHERDEVNKIFNHPDVPYDDIALLSESLGDILRELEQKESRWFELNEKIS